MADWLERELQREDALNAAAKRAPSTVLPVGFGGVYGEPQPGPVANAPMLYVQSGPVWTSVNAVSNRIASATLRLMELQDDGDDEEVRRHALLDLLNAPNPFMTGFWLTKMLASDYLTNGNSYWFLAGPASGQPSGIWRLRPQDVRIVRDKQRLVAGFVYEVEGQLIPLDPAEVIWIAQHNPLSDLYGIGNLAAAALNAKSEISMNTWNYSTFSRDYAVPAGVLNITDFVSDNDFARLKTEWRESYGGGQRKTAFLRGGNVKYEPIGLTQTELDFLNGLQWQEDAIYKIFGAHHLVSGQSEEVKKNNERLYLEETIWPLCVAFAAELTTKLLPYFGQDYRFEFEDVRPRERALDLDEDREQAKGLTLNEWRAKQKLEPLPGGDDVLFVHVQNGTLVEFERAAQPEPAPVPPQLQQSQPAPDDDDESDATRPESADETAEDAGSAGDDVGDDVGASTDKSAKSVFYDFGFDIPLANDGAVQIVKATAEAVDKFKEWDWEQPDGYHLSLAYANHVLPVEIIRELFWHIPLNELASAELRFTELAMWEVGSAYEYAPSGEGFRALVIEVERTPELDDLQAFIVEQFRSQGLEIYKYGEPAKWKPHITLAYGYPSRYEPPALPDVTYPMANQVRLLLSDPTRELRRWSLSGVTPDNKSAADSDPAAIGRELAQWRKYALRRLPGGDVSGFTPEVTPAFFAAIVARSLDDCETPDEVKAVFRQARELLLNGFAVMADNAEPERHEWPAESMKAIQATRLDFENDFADLLTAALNGDLNRRSWSARLRTMLRVYGTKAYTDGLIDGGVEDGTLDDDDKAELNRMLADQSGYVTELGAVLFRDDDTVITEAQERAKPVMWFNKSVMPLYEAGRLSADKNGMYEWVIGPTGEHCRTCSTASGQVHRLRDWHRTGIIPRADILECNGFNCSCQLVATKGKARGRLTAIPTKSYDGGVMCGGECECHECDHEHDGELLNEYLEGKVKRDELDVLEAATVIGDLTDGNDDPSEAK